MCPRNDGASLCLRASRELLSLAVAVLNLCHRKYREDTVAGHDSTDSRFLLRIYPMSMPGKRSSIVVAAFLMAAVAVLPTAAVAQQADSVAVSDTDTSAREAPEPTSGSMVIPSGAVQQILQQMVGGTTTRKSGVKAAPRVGRSADSAAVIKGSSDSTVAESTTD